MSQSFFERVRLCLKPHELASLIHESFSHQETARLMAAEGISYPGVRIESVPHEELTLGWAEDALENPVVLSGLVRALDKAHEKEILARRSLSRDDIQRLIKDMPEICREGKIGGLLWALIRDDGVPAPMVREFLNAFYRHVDKQARQVEKFENFENHLLQGHLTKKETEKIRQILLSLIAENKEIKRQMEKEIKDTAKKERQLEDLKRKSQVRESEIISLRNDLARLRKEMALKDSLIRELEEKSKTVSKQEEKLLRRRIHDFERNERKLNYDITELNEKFASAQSDIQLKEARCQNLQQELQQVRRDKERLEGELKRLSVQTATRDVQATPVAKPVPTRKANDRRLGIFVDMRSLWQASKRLQRKIDFQKLLDFIVLDRHLVKSVAYVMASPEIDHSRFLNMLEQKGFQVRSRYFIRFPDGSTQGNWGAGIATDVIHLSEKMNLDIVHLVSGDADFIDLLRFLRAKGIRTEASGFQINSAVELTQAIDEFVPLGNEIFRDPSPTDDHIKA